MHGKLDTPKLLVVFSNMAVYCSGLCLAMILGFLQIRHSFCTYYPIDDNNWKEICPTDKCFTVDLSVQKKLIFKGSTDTTGFLNKIYCIKPVHPLSLNGLRLLWFCNQFGLSSTSDKVVTIVIGNSTKDVMQSIELQTSSVWTQSKRVVNNGFGSSPYEVQCAGLKVMSDKTVNMDGNNFKLIFDRRLNLFLFVALFLGILLFFVSPYLTKNTHFYYSSGVLLGVVASILILLYIFSKFVPKKNIFGLGILLGGYTFTGYVFHLISSQGIAFVQDNLFFVACYIVISGMISFAVLYRIGPAHERTMTLVRWFLQLVGLCLIFLSIQFRPFGVGIVTSLLLWNNIPAWMSRLFSTVFFFVFCCLKPLRKLFRRRIKKKMLTQEEYEEQGVRETEKSLNALRSYCRKKGNIWNSLNTFKGEDELKGFLVGKDHIPKHQRKHHERLYDDSECDSDEDTADHTPHNLSNLSSGVPSPNPSPPSPPYPIDYISPHQFKMPSPKMDYLPKKYFTTYV